MNNDSIATALDLTPLEPTKKELVAIKTDNDYETAKGNMHNVIDVGTRAMTDLADMAQQSQDPRVYRVLTELISAMTTANKELMEIKSKEVDIRHKEEKTDNSPKTVNQNLFVGSTAELLKLMQKKEQ
jgi:hypothetical protein